MEIRNISRREAGESLQVMNVNLSRKMTAALFVFLIALDILMRLKGHAPNFTPVAASALFAGFMFGNTMLATAVPILAMAAGDFVIGSYDWHVMLVVYAAMALPVLLGRGLRGNPGAARIVTAAIAGSFLFFLTTNFAVWYWEYARDMNGLLRCYEVAIPFFRNTVAGDLFWSGVLFTGYAFVRTIAASPTLSLAHSATKTLRT